MGNTSCDGSGDAPRLGAVCRKKRWRGTILGEGVDVEMCFVRLVRRRRYHWCFIGRMQE